jgi:hypothetical protein
VQSPSRRHVAQKLFFSMSFVCCLFFFIFLIAEAIVEYRDHLLAEQINRATSESERLLTINFFSQLMNPDYESSTVNRSATKFQNFYEMKIFHEADTGNQWAAGFFFW